MAVDYTQFDTYKTTKSTYKDAYTNAHELDKQKGVKNALTWGTTGASLFSGLFTGSSLLGFALGWIGGGLREAFSPEDANRRQLYSEIRQKNTDYYNAASTAQDARNQYISQAQYFTGQTKSSFSQKYGKDSFSMLEATITSLLDMDSSTAGQRKMSDILGGLSRDSIVGDIETRLLSLYQTQDVKKEDGTTEKQTVNIGGDLDKETLDAMSSAYLNLEDLGKYYIQSLYENIVNADSTYGDTAEQLSEEQKLAAEQVEQSMSQTMLNTSQKFSELFLNQRSSNISNAEEMGKSEAASGASGIRASKSSRTNNLVTKMSQDVANASYAILYNSYKKQLQADIDSGAVSREQIGFQYASQINSLRKQIRQSTEEDINSWFHTASQYVSSIGDQEMATDTNIASAKAGEDFLTSNGQDSNSYTRKYIYNTNTATV